MPTNSNKNIRLAFKKGYKVLSNGTIKGPSNKIRKLNLYNGYYRFSIKNHKNKNRSIFVHRLAGYQLFGEAALYPNIEVRHLDNNSINNSLRNIAIGSHQENMLDIPKYKRNIMAISGATKNRKFTDAQIKDIRKKHKAGLSYTKLMQLYNIFSKGTISYIINNKYKTKK